MVLMGKMLLKEMIASKLFSVLIFLILAVIVMVPPNLVLKYWYTTSGILEQNVKLITQKFPQEILFEVEAKADLLSPLHLSTANLARYISSTVNDQTQLSLPLIESEVAPLLFQAFSTIPYLSQVSYIQKDGLLFSYYYEGNQQPVAVYTNTSFISVDEKHNFTCYSQPADRDTGILYGVASSRRPSKLLNSSILQVFLNSTNGTASVGPSWIDDEDLLFLNTALVDGRGAILLGFEAKATVQSLYGNISNGGSLFLGTKDRQVLIDATIPNTRIVIVSNNSVALKLLNQNGDQVGDIAGNLTCQANDGTVRPMTITILETQYDVYCSQVEILGVELVFVLAMQPVDQGPEGSLHKHFKESFQYLLGAICPLLVFIFSFVVLIVTAFGRETRLRCALKKQMAATAQEERKGIKKSTNYANASHDVRASLAGITGLIEICMTQVEPGSDLEANIILMKKCSEDLLGIINNILDRSKLEAGKVSLEQEEFQVSQLLEDVADLFHAVGMKKGVDVVLDLGDGSVNKFDHVRGDRKKLKQILSNLVSNAVKFTSEGHVSIRAAARKPTSSGLTIPQSSRKGPLSWLPSIFCLQKEEAYTETNVDDRKKDENCIEFVFEVDDTGVGIPKDKQETVFENYAQIKYTSAEQEGTGLGLGIVQSLVRLMGGEIEIVDKEVGKKGTCFKFNTYLPLRETNQRANSASDRYADIESNVVVYNMLSGGDSYIEGSQVLLFIQNEERRKVCKTFMERLGIKVLVARHYEELSSTLNRMRNGSVLSLNSSSLKQSDALESVAASHNLNARWNLILLVIDTTCETFGELSRVVAEFKKNLNTGYNRVVWLDRYGTCNIQLQGKLPASDIIISKPFHGTRLYQVLKLLPEFGAQLPVESSEADDPISTASQPSPISSPSDISVQNEEIKEVNKALSGKKVLIVEDDEVLQTIAKVVLSTLGATFEISVNGLEALQTVQKGLQDRSTSGNPHSLPFDYIFMDCQMPVMNGIEATRKIREEEAKYGVHMPIFAVSAHTDGPEIELMKEAGVDYNLSKPLNTAKLEELLNNFEF